MELDFFITVQVAYLESRKQWFITRNNQKTGVNIVPYSPFLQIV